MEKQDFPKYVFTKCIFLKKVMAFYLTYPNLTLNIRNWEDDGGKIVFGKSFLVKNL